MDMARAPWRPTATATWQSYPFNFHKHSESEKKKIQLGESNAQNHCHVTVAGG